MAAHNGHRILTYWNPNGSKYQHGAPTPHGFLPVRSGLRPVG